MGVTTTASAKYSEDALPAYTPMPWYGHYLFCFRCRYSCLSRSLEEIRAVIPAELFVRNTVKGLLYFARDVLMAAFVWSLATTIDPYFKQRTTHELLTPVGAEVARWAAWGV